MLHSAVEIHPQILLLLTQSLGDTPVMLLLISAAELHADPYDLYNGKIGHYYFQISNCQTYDMANHILTCMTQVKFLFAVETAGLLAFSLSLWLIFRRFGTSSLCNLLFKQPGIC